MTEPTREPRRLRNAPKTEGFQLLFSSDLFERQPGELIRPEQERAALIAITTPDGKLVQFVVRIVLPRNSETIHVVCEATPNAIQEHPELSDVKFLGKATGTNNVAQALKSAFTDLGQAGYVVDPAVSAMLHAG